MPVPRYKLSLCHTPIKPDFTWLSEDLVSTCMGACVALLSRGSHQYIIRPTLNGHPGFLFIYYVVGVFGRFLAQEIILEVGERFLDLVLMVKNSSTSM